MIYFNRPTRLAAGLEQRIIDAIHGQIPAAFHAATGENARKSDPR